MLKEFAIKFIEIHPNVTKCFYFAIKAVYLYKDDGHVPKMDFLHIN
ncbi:hypothetical protein N473_01880 [Pseudoalteromonas luteoviolacea CPMOR-1]|uniref:Uncharacterized protein n=1 Tax=Pseudoalteromonas luteoviolacea CPMOR-1 TaxID=1365248 RepID=A0A162BJJ7_9GAMM|nr:hypothetical protein N473_01880 [Pseudoalteromonas luteoviolacea CPMOR-1]